MVSGGRRGRRFSLLAGFAVLVGLGASAWHYRDRLAEAWDFHLIETASPDRSGRVLARRMKMDPLRAAPYAARQILDPAKLAWVEATVDALGLDGGAPPNPLLSPREPAPWYHLDRRALRRLTSTPALPESLYESFTSGGEQREFIDALAKGSPDARIQALALLVRVRSPATVPEQWTALGDLKKELVSRAWDEVLLEIERAFDPVSIAAEISGAPEPSGRWRRDYAFEWSVRAAGVARLASLLPRLRDLSADSDANISVAAARSLEDFSGPDADEALTHCLLEWRYFAFVRAGRALLERNPELLLDVLRDADAPESCKGWKELFQMHGRARLEDRRSSISAR
jgi:hypothetical protein